MATALARGWAAPVLVSDPDRARAERLASATGGSVLSSNRAVAEAADVVILCHKPNHLEEVAAEIDGVAKCVVSILGSVPLSDIRNSYRQSVALRVLPNLPVELKKGVLCWPVGNGTGPEATSVRSLFAQVGTVIEMDEALIEPAMALSSNAPAFIALIAESLVDSGIKHGLPKLLAHQLSLETLAGTAALLELREHDTAGVQAAVASPGGSTARGLAALEAAGVREAFDDALEAVLGGKPK